MNTFQSLFGIPESDVKQSCIITPIAFPFILKTLDMPKLKKGFPYACTSNDHITLIQSHIGTAFTGDAVLHLENTPCENIVLFGSCGLVEQTQDKDIGTLLSPTESIALESFSSLLTRRSEYIPHFSPHKIFQQNFLSFCHENQHTIIPAKCATFGSIKLEENYSDFLHHQNIDCLDMECSAFFAASQHVQKKALALFYATDILNINSPFEKTPKTTQKNISATRIEALKILSQFLIN